MIFFQCRAVATTRRVWTAHASTSTRNVATTCACARATTSSVTASACRGSRPADSVRRATSVTTRTPSVGTAFASVRRAASSSTAFAVRSQARSDARVKFLCCCYDDHINCGKRTPCRGFEPRPRLCNFWFMAAS